MAVTVGRARRSFINALVKGGANLHAPNREEQTPAQAADAVGGLIAGWSAARSKAATRPVKLRSDSCARSHLGI